MKSWNKQLEGELSLLIKDWLKQQGKTQKDIKKILNASSDRMPTILEIIKHEYSLGGIPKVASLLCSIEATWSEKKSYIEDNIIKTDPFSQLDLLLEEIQEDCIS